LTKIGNLQLKAIFFLEEWRFGRSRSFILVPIESAYTASRLPISPS